uniref:Kinesin motor domain-containing protein n=1 Tax=Kalanchoe fedtschenkoi TaxID=63787 RepID=A0A7N0ZWY7_KALFE
MKHFMPAKAGVLREAEKASTPSTPVMKQRSVTPRKQKFSAKENAPPVDLNVLPDQQCSPSVKYVSPASGKLKSPLPPRPPNSNPLKRKLIMENLVDNAVLGGSDAGVQVVVRMRPLNKEEEGEMIVEKVSGDSLTINGHSFTFDSVADIDATQQDIFDLVGAPLVENCLDGFNSSVFAYGQTGSGKTYTMWGPANALLEGDPLSIQQGLTPRVFSILFARINEEQVKHADKQLTYQCRCSFLEIYNEQITDLFDPRQKNLQIREDVKSGVYVEGLTEVHVSSMKELTENLIKGLSNRRIGATSINSESSRSHSVFTCVVESQCKRVADGLSSFKTSRINLVDLAGSERQKLTGAAGERLKEAGNINRSLSQLGNLINILAEVSQNGKQRHIPYRDSRLTFLLQDSLGGNAKLAMICAISPAESCRSETFSTLRFAQRAKAIKNKAVVNEVMQDDVKVLREVIRQLKDELVRIKENRDAPANLNGGYSSGWDARRSLSLIKFSLNRPTTLPLVDDDDDGDEVMNINDNECEGHEQIGADVAAELTSLDTDINMGEGLGDSCDENDSVVNVSDGNEMHTQPIPNGQGSLASESMRQNPAGISSIDETTKSGMQNCSSPLNLDAVAPEVPPILKSPSVSPQVIESRKSIRTSKMSTASQKDSDILSPGAAQSSLKLDSSKVTSMLTQTRKSLLEPNEQLAASLHRGLEIIGSHRRSFAARQSSLRFSIKPPEYKPILPIDKVDVGTQTHPEEDVAQDISTLCSNCQGANSVQTYSEATDNSDLQLVVYNGTMTAEKAKLVPKAVEKVLAGAIRREMALEEFCAKQATDIKQLNRLVQQYKHERECNAIIGQTREDKILRLQSLMDGFLPTEEFMEEELLSLKHEHELLKNKYENHPELLRTQIELQNVQYELEQYRNFFSLGEREVLMEEIQDLRNQLQYYVDSSSVLARKRGALLKLAYSCDPSLYPPPSAVPGFSVEDKLEQERLRWNEAESKWISLAEELRIELEESRCTVQKQKLELDLEKKCAEELKEAMQMAMQGHARMLEQYADLEEKHIELLARHRKIREGSEELKKVAFRAGARGADSKFINILASQISALKVGRDKERQQLKEEIKVLQAQLRDTAEAVEAAGELLARLKETEEVAAAAERRALDAEQETKKTQKQINRLKRKYEADISILNQCIAESRLPVEALIPTDNHADFRKDNVHMKPEDVPSESWREEFVPLCSVEDGDLPKVAESPSSWFNGYDRCNI